MEGKLENCITDFKYKAKAQEDLMKIINESQAV